MKAKILNQILDELLEEHHLSEKKLKELDPSGEILRQFFRYWNSTPSGLGSPLRRKVDP